MEKVDVIFLNAGIMPSSPLSALKVEGGNQMVDINLKGVLNGLAAVLPEFIKQKSGHVITTSSVAGIKAYPGRWGLRCYEMGCPQPDGSIKNGIRSRRTKYSNSNNHPAAINTELLDTITDESAASGMNALYEQHGISPDRIANVVAFANQSTSDVNVSEFTVGPTTQPW